jgi:c-di-GMP-related signal transduction protein
VYLSKLFKTSFSDGFRIATRCFDNSMKIFDIRNNRQPIKEIFSAMERIQTRNLDYKLFLTSFIIRNSGFNISSNRNADIFYTE